MWRVHGIGKWSGEGGDRRVEWGEWNGVVEWEGWSGESGVGRVELGEWSGENGVGGWSGEGGVGRVELIVQDNSNLK